MTKLQLIPVLEVEPGNFRKSEIQMPDGSVRENPKGWDKYWRSSLSDSGITNITPYEIGSWFVSLKQVISNRDMFSLLLNAALEHLDKTESELSAEEFGSLNGGFVVELNGAPIIYPECCGALENISEWKRFALSHNKEEEMLWIGHPWLMVKSLNEETLQLRKTSEYGEPEAPVLHTIDKKQLLKAIESSEVVLSELYHVLVEMLPQILEQNLSSSMVEQVCNIMVYGHEGA